MNTKNLKVGQQVEIRTGEVFTIGSIDKTSSNKYFLSFEELPKALFAYDNKCKILTEHHYAHFNFDIISLVKPSIHSEQELVVFNIPFHRLEESMYTRLLYNCFGIRSNELPTVKYHNRTEELTIICTHKQFSKFIIERCAQGYGNWVKELDAKTTHRYNLNSINWIYVAENP